MDNDNNVKMTPAADDDVTTEASTTEAPEAPKKNGRKKVVEPEPPVEEMVTIKLPRTKDGPKEVMVSVNGDKFLIKCGCGGPRTCGRGAGTRGGNGAGVHGIRGFRSQRMTKKRGRSDRLPRF